MSLLVMCIGNREGGDDAIGPYIADRLKSTNIDVMDCGTTPENYTGVVKKRKPEHLVIIDAIDMGLTPGSVRIVPKENIGTMHVSTHGIPLSVLITYLERFVEKVSLLGIQPKTMSGELTDTVKKSGEKLIEIIKKEKVTEIKELTIM